MYYASKNKEGIFVRLTQVLCAAVAGDFLFLFSLEVFFTYIPIANPIEIMYELKAVRSPRVISP